MENMITNRWNNKGITEDCSFEQLEENAKFPDLYNKHKHINDI